MKAVGIIKKFDGLGRVVIPKSLREQFGLMGKAEVEVLPDDNGIYLKKYEPECFVCGSLEDIHTMKNKKICRKCLEKLNK